jgi:hypothetical protein
MFTKYDEDYAVAVVDCICLPLTALATRVCAFDSLSQNGAEEGQDAE